MKLEDLGKALQNFYGIPREWGIVDGKLHINIGRAGTVVIGQFEEDPFAVLLESTTEDVVNDVVKAAIKKAVAEADVANQESLYLKIIQAYMTRMFPTAEKVMFVDLNVLGEKTVVGATLVDGEEWTFQVRSQTNSWEVSISARYNVVVFCVFPDTHEESNGTPDRDGLFDGALDNAMDEFEGYYWTKDTIIEASDILK